MGIGFWGVELVEIFWWVFFVFVILSWFYCFGVVCLCIEYEFLVKLGMLSSLRY